MAVKQDNKPKRKFTSVEQAARSALLGEDTRSQFSDNIAAKRSVDPDFATPKYNNNQTHDDVSTKLVSSAHGGVQDDFAKDGINASRRAGPNATPPGATPPVGSEPIKKPLTNKGEDGQTRVKYRDDAVAEELDEEVPQNLPEHDGGHGKFEKDTSKEKRVQFTSEEPKDGEKFPDPDFRGEINSDESDSGGARNQGGKFSEEAKFRFLRKARKPLKEEDCDDDDKDHDDHDEDGDDDDDKKKKHMREEDGHGKFEKNTTSSSLTKANDQGPHETGVVGDQDKGTPGNEDKGVVGNADEQGVSGLVKSYVKDREGVSVDEDVQALFQGETLTETFQDKAKTIFEAAVVRRATEVAELVEEHLIREFNEAEKYLREQLTNQVNDYLNYMVEEWVAENEIAIERGLRTELAEEFISSMHKVFVEHYIDIPEDKVNVVTALTEKVEKLEKTLSEEVERNVTFHKELSSFKKEDILREMTQDLTDVQFSKMHKLTESVDFGSEKEFAKKVSVLKESYFPAATAAVKGTTLAAKGLDMDNEPKDLEVYKKEVAQTTSVIKESTDPDVKAAVRMISRTKNNMR